jgi:archaellum component FlaG (FlaF/FlaG flagellin family)
MDKVLTTVLLLVAAIVTVVMVINAVYPAVGLSTGALSSASSKADDIVKSQINIIHATGELDSNGTWQDTNSDGKFNLFIWVKNTGTVTIDDMQSGDVFIGSAGIWTRIPNINFAQGSLPSWDYVVENGSDWGQSNTIEISVSYASPLPPGEYTVKVTIPNGVSDEITFNM